MLEIFISPFLNGSTVNCRLSLKASEQFNYIKAVVKKFLYKEEIYEDVLLPGYQNNIKQLTGIEDTIEFPLFELTQYNREYFYIFEIQVSSTSSFDKIKTGQFITSDTKVFTTANNNEFHLLSESNYISYFLGEQIDEILTQKTAYVGPVVHVNFILSDDSQIITSDGSLFKSKGETIIAQDRKSLFSGTEIDNFVGGVLNG